jgi:hypothetical protein
MMSTVETARPPAAWITRIDRELSFQLTPRRRSWHMTVFRDGEPLIVREFALGASARAAAPELARAIRAGELP